MSAWLVFDTQGKQVGVASAVGQALTWFPVEGREKSWVTASEQALSAIGSALAQVQQISVIQGFGGFSDTRGAVLLANTLQWQNPKLALTEYVQSDATDNPDIRALMAKSQSVTELKPRYFAEPNITQAK